MTVSYILLARDAILALTHCLQPHPATMDEYLNAIYSSDSAMSSVLRSLPMPVLKADILRYTILLHKGGIYSDVDTAAVRKFDDWGHNAGDMARAISNPHTRSTNLLFSHLFCCTVIDRSNHSSTSSSVERGHFALPIPSSPVTHCLYRAVR